MRSARSLTLLFILSLSSQIYAGRQRDSVAAVMNNKVTDSTKVNALIWMGDKLLYSDPDSSKTLAESALKYAAELNYPRGLVRSHLLLGQYYYATDSRRAIEEYNAGLEAAKKSGNIHGMIGAFNYLGRIYFKDGNYGLSLENYNNELKLNQQTGNKHGVVEDYLTIGVIYKEKKLLKEARSYQDLALKLAQEINDEASLAFIYDNIAQIYFTENPRSKEGLDYLLKSVELREHLPDQNSLLAGYNNLGVWYQNDMQLDKAIGYFMKVAQLSEKMSNTFGVAIAYNNMGESYGMLGNYPRALYCFQESIALAKQIRYYDLLMASYKGLTEVYVHQKDFEKAYRTNLLYMDTKDTILNESNNRQMADARTRFETEKKELQIASLNKDKEIRESKLNKQNILIYAGLIVLVLVLSLSFFIFKGYRQKHSANLQLAEKNALIEEKNKGITDSIYYAKRIQKALLTTERYLEAHLPEYFILYRPKDIVSGDFYWALETADQKLIIVTADCTGHGVPGAFMSLIGVSKLNEIVKEKKIVSPDEILNQLREEIINSLNPEGADEISRDGMDVSVCCYDKKAMSLEYSGANNPIYVVRRGTLTEYKADKFPVGKFSGDPVPFKKQLITLEKEDCIYSLTDGFADQFGGEKGKKFKYRQLQDLLVKNSSLSMTDQKEQLLKALENWQGNHEQVDDILVIGIRI